MTVSANVNKDEIDTPEAKPYDDKTSIQDLVIDEKKIAKEKQYDDVVDDDDEKKTRQDVDDYISNKCVNDRKLFMSCVNGNIDKYKSNVKLESSNQQTVWVGVSARPSVYY